MRPTFPSRSRLSSRSSTGAPRLRSSKSRRARNFVVFVSTDRGGLQTAASVIFVFNGGSRRTLSEQTRGEIDGDSCGRAADGGNNLFVPLCYSRLFDLVTLRSALGHDCRADR